MPTREEWIGRTGQEWSRRGAALDLLLGPAGQAGLRRLAPRPGERILDLGCGAGTSTAALATAVSPGGEAIGADISPDLMADARARLADTPGVTLLEVDAQTHDFGTASLDGLYSRFGSMFFPDPGAAFANLHRALKPGARTVFVAWREPARNQWASVPMTFAAEGLVAPGPGSGPGPLAWAAPSVYRPILEEAGFHDISESSHEFMAEIAEGDGAEPLDRAQHGSLLLRDLVIEHLRSQDEEAPLIENEGIEGLARVEGHEQVHGGQRRRGREGRLRRREESLAGRGGRQERAVRGSSWRSERLGL